MKRGIDVSGLSPAEKVIVAAGGLLFVDGFLPWWYRIRTPERTYLHNAGLTGWGLVAVLLGFVTVVTVVVHSTRRASAATRDYLSYMAFGLAALLALGMEARSSRVEWVGFWVAGAAAILVVAGGIRRRRERHAGWL